MSIDNLMIKLRFFIPSEPLTERIINLNRSLPKDPRQSIDANKQISVMRRVIGERLYRYLASAARNNSDNDEAVKIWECIPWGMSAMLGFPPYGDIDLSTDDGRHMIEVLNDLTYEFREWLLNQSNGYRAPWGELIMIGGDYLKITADMPGELRELERRPRRVAVAADAQGEYAIAQVEPC